MMSARNGDVEPQLFLVDEIFPPRDVMMCFNAWFTQISCVESIYKNYQM